jgi:hypothetical protein
MSWNIINWIIYWPKNAFVYILLMTNICHLLYIASVTPTIFILMPWNCKILPLFLLVLHVIHKTLSAVCTKSSRKPTTCNLKNYKQNIEIAIFLWGDKCKHLIFWFWVIFHKPFVKVHVRQSCHASCSLMYVSSAFLNCDWWPLLLFLSRALILLLLC